MQDSLESTLAEAVNDKNELVFVVTPGSEADIVKIALQYPNVRFFTCSVGNPSSAVRSYQGKLYEASFLMGVYCGNLLLQSGSHTVGYIARSFENTANINAFAIGAAMMDPECRVLLECLKPEADDFAAIRAKWQAEGVEFFADFEYPLTGGTEKRPALYRMVAGNDRSLGRPYYNWGKYYAQIIQAVVSGAWNVSDLVNEQLARNYWFGLSTGVVDIFLPQVPYQTQKMLAFFKNSIVSGGYDPFMGELHSQDGIVQAAGGSSRSGFNIQMDRLTPDKIVTMQWLAENIEGTVEL